MPGLDRDRSRVYGPKGEGGTLPRHFAVLTAKDGIRRSKTALLGSRQRRGIALKQLMAWFLDSWQAGNYEEKRYTVWRGPG